MPSHTKAYIAKSQVAGLAWSNDPKSYAGRASHAGEVKVMTQTKIGTLFLQVGHSVWC